MKSFILAIILIAVIFVFFMSVFDSKTPLYYRTMPDWIFIVVAVIILIGFLLALYWGITGVIKEQRLFNLMGICMSLVGISIYVLAYEMETGNGKESAGQFDHELEKIEAAQLTALNDLLRQTNLQAADVKMVPYWRLHKNPGQLVVCVQHGNIIGLQLKNKPLPDLANISKLTHLNWLVLENCGLKSIANLDLPKLERLAINNNQLTTLTGIERSPKITWLNFRENPLTDSMALTQFSNRQLYIE